MPSAIGCGTVNIAVSREASSVTRAVCVLPPDVIVTSEELISAACNVTVVWFRQDHVDRLASAKGFFFEVGSKPQRVVLGNDVAGKPLRAGWNRYEDEKEK